jgi:hypothetical protein
MPSDARSTLPSPTSLELVAIRTRSLSLYPNSAPMSRNTRVRMTLARDAGRVSALDEAALRHLGVRLAEDPLVKVLSFGIPRASSDAINSSVAVL